MLANVPVRRLEHKNLTIEGYSRGAVQSYWRIPELKVGFDLGAQPWSFMGTPTWFLSHTHLDHVAALPVLVSRRRMMKMSPPVIYLHEEAILPVERILKAFRALDRGRLPCDLRPFAPGMETELSRELIVEALATHHTVPSMGFVIYERRRKLKPEYQGLAGHQIRDLKFAGTEITQETRVPIVAYTGDTTPGGLDANPVLYEAQILITEVTFVAARHKPERIHKFGHIHLDDIVERRDRFRNEIIVAGHLSTRYTNQEIRKTIEERVPDMFDGRLHLWL